MRKEISELHNRNARQAQHGVNYVGDEIALKKAQGNKLPLKAGEQNFVNKQ